VDQATDRPETAVEGGFKIRQLRASDVPAVQAIDKRLTERATTWDNVDIYLAGEPLVSFVAEQDGEIIGFLLGDVKSYEFGLAESGWIETIGIDPAYQRRGIGARLIRAFVDHCRRIGINTVHTLIKHDDEEMQAFFLRNGFERGEFISMAMRL
jgi:ribosomal protein S18 acetylase RimI-like enzyme